MATIDPAVFKGMKLCISTPMYRADVCDAYQDSFDQLHTYLGGARIGYYRHKVRDTYLPRARNILAREFMATDADVQLLLDSDMGWDSADVLRMLYHIATRRDIKLLAAAYPQKNISWERVKRAVIENPAIEPDSLKYVAAGKWTFFGIDDQSHNMGEPVELTSPKAHVGTGVMLIRRAVYEDLNATAPAYFDPQMKKPTRRYFHADVDPHEPDESKRLWTGEDAWFCREYRRIGGKVWLAPWVKTEHWGPVCTYGDVCKVIDAGMELEA